jgi:hypothetical protein
MKRIRNLIALTLFLLACAAAQTSTSSLQGLITDPSGAVVPGAVVQLRGGGPEQRASSDNVGHYSFPQIRPGKYTIRVIAKGFSVAVRREVDLSTPQTADIQLTIEAETQVVNVEDAVAAVNADPSSNGGAIVLRQKELAALSDDPDELSQQLQAMAGPGAGPNGGQIYIDGFTGGNLPSKSSIREIRINSNPFSPEYDRPGFGRIEIFTKPGADAIHGQAFFQYNKEALNSRSPLLEQSKRPQYKQEFFGFNIGGPLQKGKMSYSFDAQRRSTTENAFILATDLDENLNQRTINQAMLTPQSFTTLSPRIDLALSTNHTLTVRYQNSRGNSDNQGASGFNLASRAYNSTNSENTVQATETAILSARTINETRFQFMRSESRMAGGSNALIVSVQDAFTSGGAQVGNSGSLTKGWEFSNTSTFTRGGHTIKWGGRFRNSGVDSTANQNYWGTYTFLGGAGPQLTADNQPVAGATMQLDALEVYRRTLVFQRAGMSDAQVRALGGGPYQFSINGGITTTPVSQFDLGLFLNDDWRVRPNLTLSYGLRYEAQTNISDSTNLSPRIGIAWGIGGRANRAAKTVLRAGFGSFYDRVASSLTLQALRYNGETQQSYVAFNPTTFPNVPSLSGLAGTQQPQTVYYVDRSIRAPLTYQANVGIDRQINQYARVSVNYTAARGVHLARQRNINTPIGGLYPSGDAQVRMLAESTGFSRSNQLMISPTINYKKLFLFGFYGLAYGKTDAEGLAADPYNLRAEWGPSSFADIRHRFVMGTNLPLPLKISISPFVILQSGSPYNITTGRDPNRTGSPSVRPALAGGASEAACRGGSLVWAAEFGCFDVNPAAGVATIERNYGRGPGSATLMLRLSRTWAFGGRRETDPNAASFGGPGGGGPPPGGGAGGGGMRGGGPGGGGPPGGGPPPGGAPPGMGLDSGRRYTITFGANAMNALNHPNYGAPNGNLSSPYFGEYRSLGGGFGPMGGGSTYNRKIDFQLRFGF